jgi:heme exporter protein D
MAFMNGPLWLEMGGFAIYGLIAEAIACFMVLVYLMVSILQKYKVLYSVVCT